MYLKRNTKLRRCVKSICFDDSVHHGAIYLRSPTKCTNLELRNQMKVSVPTGLFKYTRNVHGLVLVEKAENGEYSKENY